MTELDLISAREGILEKLNTLFDNKAIEVHLFGSIARGDSDVYSDIDIWYIFEDEDFGDVFRKRLDYYAGLGEIIHFCEPPQNAPEGGVHTALLVKTGEVITVVDIYLCPLSTAFITEESKKLFGIELPVGIAGFNPQKVQVGKTYRIDFFIGFIFNTIKKIARKKEDPLADVLREYEALHTKYDVHVEPVKELNTSTETLELIIENVAKTATEKQQETLNTILIFARKIE
jgi:predicted nucleotidyltransferase